MATATPWMTSDALIASVKRKISFPVSQNTFSDDDILAFANEEMMISQVPSILQWHEEYLVYSVTVPIIADKDHYPIPNRAIGMRLRDAFWADSNMNLQEMTRVSADDKAFFQRSSGSSNVYKFYLENNDVVVTPKPTGDTTGYLVFYIFLRPNLLVADERAAVITSFEKHITITNSSIVAGDTVTIEDEVFTAVAGAPSTDEFQIGATSIITATNLAAAITTNGVGTATSGSPSTNIVYVDFDDIEYTFETSNTAGFEIDDQTCFNVDALPDHITSGSYVDFLQTLPGHKMLKYDVLIPSNGVTASSICISDDDLPENIVIGDYICSQNECIIPQIPTDLHNELAERTCARILAAIGDQAGLAITKGNIQEMEQHQATLLDARVDGAPKKVTNRHSLLAYGRMGTRRRL